MMIVVVTLDMWFAIYEPIWFGFPSTAARDASKERHEVVSGLVLLVLEGNGARAVADRERLRSVQPEARVVASADHSAPRAGREPLEVVANQRPVLRLGAVRQGHDGVLASKDGEALRRGARMFSGDESRRRRGCDVVVLRLIFACIFGGDFMRPSRARGVERA